MGFKIQNRGSDSSSYYISVLGESEIIYQTTSLNVKFEFENSDEQDYMQV